MNQENNLRSQAHDLKLARDYEGLLIIRERILHDLERDGTDIGGMANALNNLAALNLRLGRLNSAEGYARRAIALLEHAELAQRIESLATNHHLLSYILSAQGRFEDALVEGQLAVEMFGMSRLAEDQFLNDRRSDLDHIRNRDWQSLFKSFDF